MSKDAMTTKERWLAAIKLEPVDRLPFWPKLHGAYPPAQTGRFREMAVAEIMNWLGADPQVGIGRCWREVVTRASVEHEKTEGVLRSVWKAGGGRLEMVRHFDPASDSWHPVQYPVNRIEDVKILTEYYEDVSVEPDPAARQQTVARHRELGDKAITCGNIGISPLMDWIQHLAGVETGHYLLADYPDEVGGLFQAMHRVLRRRAEIEAEHNPAELLYVTENTSTTLISPTQYAEWCFPQIMDYAQIANARGRNMVLHMCGHLKDLLPQLARLPVRAFEAFTSPTVGNTTLLDGRSACPDKCLIGGTNAALWIRPAADIIRQIEKDLAALPHQRGIVLSSAGVMPPACAPETIRQVFEAIKGLKLTF